MMSVLPILDEDAAIDNVFYAIVVECWVLIIVMIAPHVEEVRESPTYIEML